MAEYDFEKLAGITYFADHKLGSLEKRVKEFKKIIEENIVNKLELLEESQHHLHFRYISSLTYEIFLELQHNRRPSQQNEPPDSIVVTCTCPVAEGRQSRICKHGLAALLWRLPPSEQCKLTTASATTTSAAIAAVVGNQVKASAPSAGVPPSSALTATKRERFFPQSIVNTPNTANRNTSKIAAELPTKKAKVPPQKKKPTSKVPPQSQKQKQLPTAVVSRPAHPRKLQGPKRWMDEAEMQAIADSTLLEQCKNALDRRESMLQQKQLDVQSRLPQQKGQQQAEEEEFCAPAAAPAPLPITTSQLSPLEAEDSRTAPPAPALIDDTDDDYNFAAHFLNYLK